MLLRVSMRKQCSDIQTKVFSISQYTIYDGRRFVASVAGLGFEGAEDVDLWPSTQAIDEESLGIKAHNRSSRIHVRPGLKYYL